MKSALVVTLLFPTFLWQGCYSFKNASIPPDIQTFFVDNFDVQAQGALPTLGQTFSEALKDKIRRESRLQLTDTDPDVEFSGAVTEYRVTSEAPQPGELTAINRLTIAVQVTYTNNKHEEENWSRRFSYFADFDATENLVNVQDALIETILEELVEQVFNQAFTNW